MQYCVYVVRAFLSAVSHFVAGISFGMFCLSSDLTSVEHFLLNIYFDQRPAGELCSGITHGRVLKLEIYIHRKQKLTLLHEDCINLANILMGEEQFRYERDL